MSERAIAALRDLFEGLEFFTVASTTAREPEDVLSIDLQKPLKRYPNGTWLFNGSDSTGYTRIADVPEGDRWRMRIAWRRFDGVTEDGIRFASESYHALSWTLGDRDLLKPGTDVGSTHTWDRPEAGQIICGIVEDGEQGKRLSRWFECDEAFRLLVTIIRVGTEHTEEELGRLLMTDGFPDTYWALARLALFDNVQAFVDCLKTGSPAPTVGQLFMSEPIPRDTSLPGTGIHPMFGQPHGKYDSPVDWKGMYICGSYAQFVHEFSYLLGEPDWWETFLNLADEQRAYHSHPGRGGVCQACIAGNPRHWYRDYCEDGGHWPYQ